MEIDKKILTETTECKNDFECLKNKDYLNQNCPVKEYVNRVVLFTDCKKIYCPYKMYFGYSTVCTCPTRKAIYEKHKI